MLERLLVMTNIDPDAPRTVETRTTYDPLGAGATEVTRTQVRSNSGAWWVAGIVAVVAILAIAYMVSHRAAPGADNQAVAAAAAQQGAQAQSAQDAAALAQSSAQAQAAQTTAQAQAAQTAAQANANQAAASAAAAERASARSQEGPVNGQGDGPAGRPASADRGPPSDDNPQ